MPKTIVSAPRRPGSGGPVRPQDAVVQRFASRTSCGVGWRGRIRTFNALIQSQVPYRLATRQRLSVSEASVAIRSWLRQRSSRDHSGAHSRSLRYQDATLTLDRRLSTRRWWRRFSGGEHVGDARRMARQHLALELDEFGQDLELLVVESSERFGAIGHQWAVDGCRSALHLWGCLDDDLPPIDRVADAPDQAGCLEVIHHRS